MNRPSLRAIRRSGKDAMAMARKIERMLDAWHRELRRKPGAVVLPLYRMTGW